MKKSTLLLIPAVALIIFSAVDSASAALNYVSENYNANLTTGSIDIELSENGKVIDNGSKLLTNLVEEGEVFHIGKKYSEQIAVKNTGNYDSYVRVILTKSWNNSDGTKNTSLDPSLIDLAINTGAGWTVDTTASTNEQTVLYYTKPLSAGATTPNAVEAITVLNDVTTKVTKNGTTGNITTSYDYNGKSFTVEAEADAIQTHNAQNAIYSSWGVCTTVANDGSLTLTDKFVPVTEQVITNDKKWDVVYDGNVITANFKSNEVAEAVTNAMPGDKVTFSIGIKNTNDSTSSWYLTNDIIKSLEDNSSASGGAYTYSLTYLSANGTEKVLYSSDTVGGDDASIKGLHQAANSINSYFYLDSLESGATGTVNLSITLDGNTQNNAYQNTFASLEMSFAVDNTTKSEIVDEAETETEEITNSEDDGDKHTDKPKKEKKEKKVVNTVKTGDTNNMIISMLSLVTGIILVGIWFVLDKKRSTKKGEA